MTPAQARDRIAELEEKVRQLEHDLGLSAIPWFSDLGVYGHGRVILGILMMRPVASRDTLLSAMYADDANGAPPTSSRILDITMHGLRKKMRGLGVKVRTIRGFGYQIVERDQQRLRALTGNRCNE